MDPRTQPLSPGVLVAALMPHAPVLVPQVAGPRIRDVQGSVDALRSLARTVIAVRPDSLLVISPHSPRRRDAYGVWTDRRMHGSFSDFGAPDVGVGLPGDDLLAAAVETACDDAGVPVGRLHSGPLDHGALVPLWFLAEAGWTGPTVVLALMAVGNHGRSALGGAIARAARDSGRRLAVVASGDMSHRLRPGAPGGFDPRAERFDREFIERLRHHDLHGAVHPDPVLRELAGEDVVDSTAIAAAALPSGAAPPEVLSYEGPFGVGYGVALLGMADPLQVDAPPPGFPNAPASLGALPGIARRSIATALTGVADLPPRGNGPLAEARGVFVTLKGPGDRLRGCIGTLAPTERDVVAETWRMARQAALHDPRFDPVDPGELPDLRIEVSVLHPPEPIPSPDHLDPGRYGVIVTGPGGRRGVLLPDIDGIGTVAEQVAIARRKAGLDRDVPVQLERFEVERVAET